MGDAVRRQETVMGEKPKGMGQRAWVLGSLPEPPAPPLDGTGTTRVLTLNYPFPATNQILFLMMDRALIPARNRDFLMIRDPDPGDQLTSEGDHRPAVLRVRASLHTGAWVPQ